MSNGGEGKLTLSDWITFLSGESTPAIGNVINLAAFLLAAFAMALATTLSTNDHSWIRILDIAEFGLLVLLLFIAAIITIRRHAGKAERLLNLIMLGTLKAPLDVQTGWQTAMKRDPKEWDKFIRKYDKSRTSRKRQKMHRRIFTRNKNGQ